ncbi:hypothetical protein [Timonella sp. A28]|uniref:hypothetical protein n=1 Tax=Timonella sp. A28 TaxID=3442640 RepID=UPI003EBF8602
MTTELTAKWQTIAETYPHAKQAIHTTPQPTNGMPHTPTNPQKAPLNLNALSWIEMTDRLTAKWGHTPQTMHTHITTLWNNLGPADQLDLQTDTWTIHNQTPQWLPAHQQTLALTREQTAGIYCTTIQELAWALNSLGKPTPQGTLRRWVTEGHITKTQAGYSLAQTLQRINK